jgi:hypothetical protein
MYEADKMSPMPGRQIERKNYFPHALYGVSSNDGKNSTK